MKTVPIDGKVSEVVDSRQATSSQQEAVARSGAMRLDEIKETDHIKGVEKGSWLLQPRNKKAHLRVFMSWNDRVAESAQRE